MKNMLIDLPEISSEWHPTQNTDLNLASMTQGSGRKVWWLGSCGHEWNSEIKSRVKGTGCPFCSGQKVLVGFNDLLTTQPAIAGQWHPTLNGLNTTDVTQYSSKIYWWICTEGHEWKARVGARTSGQGCPYCFGLKVSPGKNDLLTLYPQIAHLWHPTKNLPLKPENISPRSPNEVWWHDIRCGHDWQARVDVKISKKCVICKNSQKITCAKDLEKINPELAKEWHPSLNENIIISKGSISLRTQIWWLGECGHHWKSSLSNRLNHKTSCPFCSNRLVLEGFNDLSTLAPMIAEQWHPYLNGELTPHKFTVSSGAKAWWLCDKGHGWEAFIYSRRTSGCPKCSSSKFISKPEQDLADALIAHGIEVIQSDRKILKGSELDIYIPRSNLAIEYNGLFWHTDTNGKDESYHYKKWKSALKANTQLVQIWEDEWRDRRDLVMSMLLQKLNITKGITHESEDVSFSMISEKEARMFSSENQIQEFVPANFYFALLDNKSEIKAFLAVDVEGNDHFIFQHYAIQCNFLGGFTKILHKFETTFKPTNIMAFSDNCTLNCDHFSQNGFVIDSELPPDYRYLVRGVRINKMDYDLKNEDSPSKIWDAGKTRWIKNF